MVLIIFQHPRHGFIYFFQFYEVEKLTTYGKIKIKHYTLSLVEIILKNQKPSKISVTTMQRNEQKKKTLNQITYKGHLV